MLYNPDLGLLILRIVLGIIFIYHSMPKLKNPGAMVGGFGWPAWGIRVLGLVELLAGIAVIIGFHIPLAALLLALTMVGAIYKKIFAWHVSFWSRESTGWEFDLINLAAALALCLIGGGAYTLF